MLMRISIADADGRLAELVGRAEAGEEVILARAGEGAARLVPIVEGPKPSAAEKTAVGSFPEKDGVETGRGNGRRQKAGFSL
jgi:prevent-host-death family protein